MTDTFKWISPTKNYPSYNSFNKSNDYYLLSCINYKCMYVLWLGLIIILLAYYTSKIVY